MFLPEELERARQVFERAKEAIAGDEALLAAFGDFDRLMDALAATRASWGIYNGAVALMLVLDVFERHMEDLAQGWCAPDGEPRRTSWVPLASVIGTDKLPAAAAAVVKRAVDRMVDSGLVTGKARWQAMELWAADYLAGPDADEDP